MAGRFDAPKPHLGVVDEAREDAQRIAPAADARDDVGGQPAVALEHLRARFFADHPLELAHHVRVRMRTDDAADDVERVFDAGRPLAKRLVRRIFERARPAVHRLDTRAEQPHDVDVERLALDVDRAHVDVDRDPEFRADRRGRDAVLARAGLGDDRVFPIRCASSPWPIVLLILCAPVWLRSSRLKTSVGRIRSPASRSARSDGDGRPT